jgi:hypothetical protein
MKKLTTKLAICTLIIFAAITSSPAHTLLTIKSSKRALSPDERAVSNFKGISSSGSFEILVTMGNRESLRIEGDEDVIKNIETVVENGILKIRNKNRSSWNWNSGRSEVTITISAKTLNNITLSGSGNITVKGPVKSNQLTTTVSGSGNIFLTADAEEYLGTISGSGKIKVDGKADKAEIRISGSGDFEGKDLKTSEAAVRISGSGNAYISADKSIDAAVSGSGNIRYRGNAQVSKSKSGSGSISKL